MTPLRLRGLADATLRACPSLRLVRKPRVPVADREALRRFRRRQDFAGLLLPSKGGATEYTVLNADGARLWASLARPRTLRAALPSVLDPATNIAVAGMILDGLLELEHAGQFVSGLDAFPLVFEGTASEAVPRRLGRIGVRALLHATRLGRRPPSLLAAHLYRYNRIPPSASRRQAFRQLTPDTAPGAGWAASRVRPNDPWAYWTRLPVDSQPWYSGTLHKLYISPAPDHVGEALRTALEAKSVAPAVGLKLGRGLAGILRPDKLVIHFRTRAELEEAAGELNSRLAGMPAHGVPFSGSLTEDGLLSWGVDPAAESGRLNERESWRQVVTRCLGHSLAIARRGTAGALQPWQFAVYRLTLGGVALADLSLEDLPEPSAGSAG